MKNKVMLSDDRDIPMLHFLWKWKVSSTAALTKKFFPNCKGKTAYNRLLDLRQAKIIQVQADPKGIKFVCMLGQKGFDAIRGDLPPLEEEGYKSEHPEHDLFTSAFHLGDWLLAKPDAVTLFSEQQLRRIHPDYYPNWVPKSKLHRPDGYTRIQVGDSFSTTAIEVELWQKRDSDYLNVAEFYSQSRNIKRVLWLVPRQSMAITIQERMSDSHIEGVSPHNFVILEDFKNSGWHAQVSLGHDKGQSIHALFSGNVGDMPRFPGESILTQCLLDTRKSPHTSSVCRGFQLGDFCD